MTARHIYGRLAPGCKACRLPAARCRLIQHLGPLTVSFGSAKAAHVAYSSLNSMGDLPLLADDHTLLRSQVIHVKALLRVLVDGHFESKALQAELIQQMDLLGDQLIEHFEFEESTAFPHLSIQFARFSSQFQRFVSEHVQILKAFEAFRSDLMLEMSQLLRIDILSKAAFFESAFNRHATSETQLFDKLAKQLGPSA